MRTIDIPSLFTNSSDPAEPDDREYRLSSANLLLGNNNKTTKTIPPYSGGKGCPMRAPSVHYLETQFKNEIKKAGLDPSKHNIYEIQEKIILEIGRGLDCPRDGRKGCAVVDAIDGADYAGEATHMLSYTWGYVTGKIISALVEYTKQEGLNPKQTYIWICCLCINQHRVKEAELIQFEDFTDIFQKRIVGIGHLLSLIMPWDDPLYTKRVWCIYELHAAIALEVENDDNEDEEFGERENEFKFDIIMPLEEANDFATSISRGNIQKLWDALKNIKIENADATIEQDRRNIYQAIEAGTGFFNLKNAVRTKLQSWVIDSGEKIVREDLYYCKDVEKAATACANIADLTLFKGDIHRAQTLLSDTLHVLDEKGLGETISATFLTRKLGVSKRMSGDLRGALETYNRTIQLHGITNTMDTEDCANVYMNKGNIHSELNEFEEASESYISSRNIRCRMDKLESDEGALLLTLFGAVRAKMKHHKEAMASFNEANRIRILTNTTDSPDGAFLLDHIALVKGELQEFDVAMSKYEEARQLRDTLGMHRSMDGALHLAGLGHLFLNMKDFKKALEQFEEAISIHRELGTLEKSEGVEVVEAMIQCQIILRHLNDHGSTTSSFCGGLCS